MSCLILRIYAYTLTICDSAYPFGTLWLHCVIVAPAFYMCMRVNKNGCLLKFYNLHERVALAGAALAACVPYGIAAIAG